MTDESQREALKPCAHCGSPARIIKNDYEPDDPEYVAICDGCGCDIRHINKSDVVTLWNTRTADREKMLALMRYTERGENGTDDPITGRWLPYTFEQRLTAFIRPTLSPNPTWVRKVVAAEGFVRLHPFLGGQSG